MKILPFSCHRLSVDGDYAGRASRVMNETYSAYLQSRAWEAKRNQRLSLSGFKCEACSGTSKLQVHHLTYARIFQEEMEDLMALCKVHHEAAEEMVAKGVLKRTGCVRQLRLDTLFHIAPRSAFIPLKVPQKKWQDRLREVAPKRKKFKKPSKAQRRAVQRQNWEAMIVNIPLEYRHLTEKSSKTEVKSVLQTDPKFRELLELPRDEFRKKARKLFGRCLPRGRILSVAGQVYDKHTEEWGVPTGLGDGSRYLPERKMKEHRLAY